MASGLQAVSRVDSWPSGNQQVARTDEEKVSKTGTSAAIRMMGDMGVVEKGVATGPYKRYERHATVTMAGALY
jgi:hypothetical protein